MKNASILLFWNVMNLLPDRVPAPTGRSAEAEVREVGDSLSHIQPEYALYTGDYSLNRDLAY